MDKWSWVEDDLKRLREGNLYREMQVMESAQSREVRMGEDTYLMFASNSYLDLCNEPRVKAYAMQVLEEFGTGAGGSRLTTGTTRIHMELEHSLAAFKGREAALVFNTGYMANVGILQAMTNAGDVIYSDELNHASIIDGCRLSKAEVVVYKHNDMQDLEMKIKAHEGMRGIIVSDGVFSMDGDIVHLPELVALAKKYQLLSMIDEAHATGVLGVTGRGTEEYYHMGPCVDILMGTLSKSLGSEGGFVCGSNLLIEYLKNHARSFIFSTALSPAAVAASHAAVELLMQEPERVQNLQDNIRYFCRAMQERGMDVHSDSAIVPVVIGDEQKALEASQKLKHMGFYISAIRYPTVAKGRARLRIALMATHTKEQLDRLAEAVSKIKECE